MTEPNLIRFLDAQDQIYTQVVEELTNGRKQTHWMWFIFPQKILGSPDDVKLRSCLTLFREAASEDLDRLLFTKALGQFYHGQADRRTLELLR